MSYFLFLSLTFSLSPCLAPITHIPQVSSTCYVHSILLGCKATFLVFEKKIFVQWLVVAFGLVPVHISELCYCVVLFNLCLSCVIDSSQIDRYKFCILFLGRISLWHVACRCREGHHTCHLGKGVEIGNVRDHGRRCIFWCLCPGRVVMQ
jgi:hypothetical protein